MEFKFFKSFLLDEMMKLNCKHKASLNYSKQCLVEMRIKYMRVDFISKLIHCRGFSNYLKRINNFCFKFDCSSKN